MPPGSRPDEASVIVGVADFFGNAATALCPFQQTASLIHKRPTRPALWSSAANTQRQRRNFSSARTSCRHKEKGGGHGIWKRRFTLVARRAATDHHTVGLVLAPLAVRSRETRRRCWNELSHPDIPLLSNRKECDCRSSRRHHRDTAFADEVGVGVKAVQMAPA